MSAEGRKFTDGANREWIVRIDVNAIRRVKQQCDGYKLVDLRQLDELSNDPVQQVDLLVAIVQPQLTERKMSVQDFHALFDDNALLWSAWDCLRNAIFDFQPTSKCEALRETWDRVQAAESELLKSASAQVDQQVRQLSTAAGLVAE